MLRTRRSGPSARRRLPGSRAAPLGSGRLRQPAHRFLRRRIRGLPRLPLGPTGRGEIHDRTTATPEVPKARLHEEEAAVEARADGAVELCLADLLDRLVRLAPALAILNPVALRPPREMRRLGYHKRVRAADDHLGACLLAAAEVYVGLTAGERAAICRRGRGRGPGLLQSAGMLEPREAVPCRWLRGMASRTRARAQGETEQNPGGLTRREVEVLRLAARGLTTDDIAGRLYISPQNRRPPHPAHLRQDRRIDAGRGSSLGDAAHRGYLRKTTEAAQAAPRERNPSSFGDSSSAGSTKPSARVSADHRLGSTRPATPHPAGAVVSQVPGRVTPRPGIRLGVVRASHLDTEPVERPRVERTANADWTFQAVRTRSAHSASAMASVSILMPWASTAWTVIRAG